MAKKPIALATRIDAADRPFHDHLVAQVRRAHEAMAAAQAAQATWATYLTKKYNLNDRDVVEVDGQITRVPDA